MEMDFPSYKRIKLDTDSYSSDPFIVLHCDLHDLIYQHLCCEDVCKVFKVSKEWNSRTNESPKGMEKIQLNFRELSSTDHSTRSLTALLQSERMYQNIKFSLSFVSNAHRKLLILEKFSQSVSRLDISIKEDVEFKRFIPADLSFPKLKELRYEGKLPNTLFENLKTLEKLSVFRYTSAKFLKFNFVDDLDFFGSIKDNNNLKVLEMTDPFRSSYYTPQKTSVYDVKFKLDSFTMNFEYCPYEQQAFLDFLLFHSETLTSLSLVRLDSFTADFIFTKLPALKELNVRTIIDHIEVHQSNETISSLKCNTMFDVRKILESLKCIESIEVNNYGGDVFRWMIKNLMLLKKIKFKRVKWHNIPDYSTLTAAYNKFKIDDAPVNEDIEIVVE